MNDGEINLGLSERLKRMRKILDQIKSLQKSLEKSSDREKMMINSQIEKLWSSLKKTNDEIPQDLKKISFRKSLPKEKDNDFKNIHGKIKLHEHPTRKSKNTLTLGGEPEEEVKYELGGEEIERLLIKRLKKKEKKVVLKKEKKPSKYVMYANKFFSKTSKNLSNRRSFKILKTELIKANMDFPVTSYVSVLFFTTFISMFIGLFAFLFFLFFNLSPIVPFISVVEVPISTRLVQTLWILFAVPLITFFSIYIYPTLEKKSAENKINVELPFATIHMSAISGSMVDPSKIFEIIVLTKEYPNLSKQFVH